VIAATAVLFGDDFLLPHALVADAHNYDVITVIIYSEKNLCEKNPLTF